MYLRFVVDSINKRSGAETGIFTVAYDLLNKDQLSDIEAERMKELLGWFGKNLKNPFKTTKFHKGKREERFICWFKSDSQACIKNIYEMIAILEDHGFFIKCIKSDKPGKVKYEDEHQAIAIPFKDSY